MPATCAQAVTASWHRGRPCERGEAYGRATTTEKIDAVLETVNARRDRWGPPVAVATIQIHAQLAQALKAFRLAILRGCGRRTEASAVGEAQVHTKITQEGKTATLTMLRSSGRKGGASAVGLAQVHATLMQAPYDVLIGTLHHRRKVKPTVSRLQQHTRDLRSRGTQLTVGKVF